MRFLTIAAIAAICHEANRQLCEEQGDVSQVDWEKSSDDQRNSAMKGVTGILDGSILSPEDSHNSWLKDKADNGWTYGPVKDPEKKVHPCFVPYDQLPPNQQAKDHLFRNIVLALAPFCAEQFPVQMLDPEPILRFFDYNHLPAKLKGVSAPFGELATDLHRLPRSAERSVALRKLLESKDAAVRAAL